MQEQKRYHQRKLAIIEMIEECDRCILKERNFLQSLSLNWFYESTKNSQENIERYERLKTRLLKWLGESNNRN